MSAAYNLSRWLSEIDPAKQNDPAMFEEFIADTGIEAPDDDDLFHDDPVEWVRQHHAEDFAFWLDNEYDLAERFEIQRNNEHIEGGDTFGAGTWFIHFTNAKFTQFADGVTREFLGRSGAGKERIIACPQNLTLPPEAQKWIHAYPVYTEGSDSLDFNMLAAGMGYGRNALLFQSDEAVSGLHFAHEHYMAFVLGCSEYNAVFLTDLERNSVPSKWGGDKQTLAGVAELAQDDVEFDDLDELIDRLEQTATAGTLGSYRRRSRWHRLARQR